MNLVKNLRPHIGFAAATLLGLVPVAFAQTAPAPAPTRPGATSAPATPSAASTNATASPSDSVIELSPFQVDASKDTGYFAENTLAGSRLNTNIGDLAASITVVTKQQMIDTAAIDMNDVFLYEANTEGTGNYTAFNIDTRGAVQDFNAGFQGGAPSLPFGSNTSNRVRGIAAVDRARDFYPSIQRLPFDIYNTDSVEISRGPNSILFGLGSPAGIVNQSAAKADLRRSTNQVELRAGSWDAYRGSFNFNRPLIQDKLAIYVAALYDQKGFQREPSYDITRRAYGALTYKPFKNTVIRANVERYENKNRRPNTVTPRDFISPWIANGRPSYNPITRQLTVNGAVVMDGANPRIFDGTQTGFGVAGNVQTVNSAIQYFGNARPVLYIDRGVEQLYIMQQLPTEIRPTGATPGFFYSGTANDPFSSVRTTRSQGPNTLRNQIPGRPAGLIFAQPGVTDKSIYDWESINITSGNFGKDTANIYNVELEQQITPDLFLQLGWYREDFKQRVDYYISQQTGVTLYVDTNTVNIDGSANPFFGRPYIELTQPDQFEQPEDNENARATLAYDLDLSKRGGWMTWLGRHRVMGLAQKQWIRRTQLRNRPYIAGNSQLWNAIPRAGNPLIDDVWAGNTTQNAIERRFYVGDNTGRVTHDPGLYPDGTRQHSFRWFNPATSQWQNDNITVDTALHFVSSRSKQRIRTYAIALQDYLFQDRLITTFGMRRDKSTARTSTGLTRTSAGLTNPANLDVFGAAQVVADNTRTHGAVLKPFKGWSSLDASAERGNTFSEVVRSLSFHYNKSDNFVPQGITTDFYGSNLSLPTGKGEDYGLGLALFNNKLYARLNWFKTSQNNARGAVVAQPLTRTLTVDDVLFRSWAQMVTGSANVNAAAVANIVKLPAGYAALPLNSLFAPLVAVGATSTVEAEGMELTLTYNPTRNWNIKFTAGKQETIFSRIAPEWDAWKTERMALWTTATAPGFTPFWSSTGQTFTNAGIAQSTIGATQTVADWWFTNVEAIMSTAKRLEGKVTSDQRKWRWNVITNYTFESGPLANFGVGGAARWEDKAAIGYLGSNPDPDGIIRTLDVNRPVFSGEAFHVDLWASYRIKSLPWFGDKVGTKLQLNVRDVLEGGGLEPLAVNPDGQKIAFRIKDPRQWYLTATFDF
jgi:outer membrane receptor protein involved in Fe transport